MSNKASLCVCAAPPPHRSATPGGKACAALREYAARQQAIATARAAGGRGGLGLLALLRTPAPVEVLENSVGDAGSLALGAGGGGLGPDGGGSGRGGGGGRATDDSDDDAAARLSTSLDVDVPGMPTFTLTLLPKAGAGSVIVPRGAPLRRVPLVWIGSPDAPR